MPVKGRGRHAHEPFALMLDDQFPRIPGFDVAGLSAGVICDNQMTDSGAKVFVVAVKSEADKRRKCL